MAAQDGVAIARSAVYAFLASAFLYPEEGASALLREGAQHVIQVAVTPGWPDVAEIADCLHRALGAADDEALEGAYVEVFGHTVSAACPPYECEYGQAHVFQQAGTLAELNAFYKAFGMTVHPALKERPDHISIEMDFMHLLTLKEAYARLQQHGDDKVELCRQAQERFLAHHLSPWINAFVLQLGRKAGHESAYGSLARLLGIHMTHEFAMFRLSATPDSSVARSVLPEDEDGCGSCPVVSGTIAEGYRP